MKKILYYFCCTFFYLGIAIPDSFAQDFVSSEKCLTCHKFAVSNKPAIAGWTTTFHATGITPVIGDSSMIPQHGVVCDANQNGIDDFKDGLDLATTTAFSAFGANAPKLAYDETNGYQVTIGDITYTVLLTYGGSGVYKQRYIAKIPVGASGGVLSDGYYVLPIQFNEATHQWVQYSPDHWYEMSTHTPLFTSATSYGDVVTHGKSFDQGCAGCHFTGMSLNVTANGEFTAKAVHGSPLGDALAFDYDGDGIPDEINTGCLDCHYSSVGNHMATGVGVVNPKSLGADRSSEVCGRCHSRGKSVGTMTGKTVSYPWAGTDDAHGAFLPGDTLANFYTDGGGYWGNPHKASKKHHQQWLDWKGTPHATTPYNHELPTSEGEVNCYSCHDPHNKTEWGHQLRLNPEDNSLCLDCHLSPYAFKDLSAVETHTMHPYNPTPTDGSDASGRCTACHYPKSAKSAVAYDVSHHGEYVLTPDLTLQYKMPNSCAMCHNQNKYGEGAVDTLLATWSNPEDSVIAAWAESYMPLFTHDRQINTVQAKKIPSGTSPPILDGVAEDVWNLATSTKIDMVIPGVHQSAMSTELKVVYDKNAIYLLAKWADPTFTVRRQELVYKDGTWSKTDETDLIREDRIGIFWPITEIEGFGERGCMASCHNTRERWGKYLQTGELGDMWHSKGARTWPFGHVDDKFTDGNYKDASGSYKEDGGRHGDGDGSTYYSNLKDGVPQWMGPAHNSNPAALYDSSFAQEPFPGTWAVQAKPYDPNAGWQNGDRLPKYVGKKVDTTLPRANLVSGAKWENGYWTLEISRALNTGDAEHDVIFDDLTKAYPFAVAIIDNGTQPAGRVYPNLHSHQGADYNMLVFEEFTDVNEIPFAMLPQDYRLQQNYPNPFNPITKIAYDMKKSGHVQLAVYDMLGKRIQTLVDDYRDAGSHEVEFAANDLPSGIYFYTINVNGFRSTQKMILMK